MSRPNRELPGTAHHGRKILVNASRLLQTVLCIIITITQIRKPKKVAHSLEAITHKKHNSVTHVNKKKEITTQLQIEYTMNNTNTHNIILTCRFFKIKL